MTVSIRPYTPKDREACMKLWRELTERHRIIYEDPTIGGDTPEDAFHVHMGRSDLVGMWVAEQDGVVVGMCGLLAGEGEGEVEPIVVSERVRSGGIGATLLEHMKDEARSRSWEHLNIRPVARNVEAIQMFQREGFRTLGHLQMFVELEGDRRWKSGVKIHDRDFEF